MNKQVSIIIGAGPAGLTAAYELLKRTDITPIVYEATGDIGGISKTINYKGNRMDIGGHRFFSKSDRVMQWWKGVFPIQNKPAKDDLVLARNMAWPTDGNNADPEHIDNVFLIRNRLSRILFEGHFFDYPVSLSLTTFQNLGLLRLIKIGVSYGKIRLFPIRTEKTLEHFFINKFGNELYQTFFKDYTEKVWGVGCDKIKPEWGTQRIKGLSVTGAVIHALKKMTGRDSSLSQKATKTTLIERFLYPKLGPGQLWEEVAHIIRQKGGQVHLNHKVAGLNLENNKITQAQIQKEGGRKITVNGQYFFSTMPVNELIMSLAQQAPKAVRDVADGLMYRDFITVGLLLTKLKIKNRTKIKTIDDIVPDNWIYIQEKDIHLGRLQIFNNWSPYMVSDPGTVWIGLEYFCNEGDRLWNKSDTEFAKFAIEELSRLEVIDKTDVLDRVVVRVPKTYPAYVGSYNRFSVIRDFTDSIENLFLIGRNGMHKYNNQDHSMLSAMTAVDNLADGIKSKDNIWAVNAEKEYHE